MFQQDGCNCKYLTGLILLGYSRPKACHISSILKKDCYCVSIQTVIAIYLIDLHLGLAFLNDGPLLSGFSVKRIEVGCHSCTTFMNFLVSSAMTTLDLSTFHGCSSLLFIMVSKGVVQVTGSINDQLWYKVTELNVMRWDATLTRTWSGS